MKTKPKSKSKPKASKTAMTTCLWFDKNAEDAARFYARTFPNSRVTSVLKSPADYPNGKAGDEYVDKRLAAQKVGDANDLLFQWSSSRDFDPTAGLDRITAPLLAINSADDERNPPELGIFEREMKRIPKGQVYMIPASAETGGHGTTGSMARLYAEPLAKFLAAAPKRNAP